ncbi:MAG TPA: hypothetical protein VG389_09530 [Myxococcota bacterium]|jgi:hypothetical protein|nr:hypothetical protein [Myxococcota bacterium]
MSLVRTTLDRDRPDALPHGGHAGARARARRRAAPLAVALVLAPLVPFVACTPRPAAPVVSPDGAVVDADYRFRLARPGPRWRILDPVALARLGPLAVAAAETPDGLVGAVLVEPAPEAALAAYGRAVIDAFTVAGKEVLRIDETTYAGASAVRFLFTGASEGHTTVCSGAVMLRQGFGYRLVACGALGRAARDGSTFQPFFDAFTLLDGEIHGRVRDAAGVGWRVRGDVFESASHAVAAAPHGPWSLVVGDRLAALDSDAAVVIARYDLPLYVAIITERVKGVPHAPLLARADARLAAAIDGAALPGKARTLTLDGRAVTFGAYAGRKAPDVEYQLGVLFEGDRWFRVLVWYGTAQRAAAAAALPEALAAVHFLDAGARGALAEELLHLPDPEAVAAPTFGLVAGFYWDAGNGFTWRKPRGFWHVSAGAAAAHDHPDAALFLEEAAAGINGMVIAETLEGVDAPSYHRLVLTAMFGAGHAALGVPAETIALGDARALSTEAESTAGDLPMRWRVTTVMLGARAYQILFWGFPAHMKEAAAAVREAIAGFKFGSDMSVRAERPERARPL